MKDEIWYFISECRNKRYYEKKVNECNEKLEVLNAQIEGVSSPTVKDVIYENARNPYQERKNILITEEEKVIHERKYWENRINYIEEVFKCIHNKKDRTIIYEMYVDRQNREELANKYFYANHTSLRRYAIKKIEKALKVYHGSQKKDVK